MWDAFLLDMMYLCSDILTGRGIPVVLAVTYFHLDDYLTSTMVMMGLVVAFFYNIMRRIQAPRKIFLELRTALSCAPGAGQHTPPTQGQQSER